MRTAVQVIAIASSVVLGGCNYYEARRVISQSEKELSIQFSVSPKMLQSESYGWAEEGGDRTLLQLSAADCALIGRQFPEIAPAGIESSRMFTAAGTTPTHVRRKFEMNEHGDTREYELDEASCLLFRQAHFE